MKKRRESNEDLKKRASAILRRLGKIIPEPSTALRHSSPLEMLIATILSAQCTDERVNIVTANLFRDFRTAKDFAQMPQAELEMRIKSTGFFRAKARNIIKCCEAIVKEHRGAVPETMEELTRLAGVGRKTANVVLGNCFGKTEGIVVDTHVKRLAGRLGLARAADPEGIEKELMAIIPRRAWIDVGNLLIWHGRRTCNARKPKCTECALSDLCPSAELPSKQLHAR